MLGMCEFDIAMEALGASWNTLGADEINSDKPGRL